MRIKLGRVLGHTVLSVFVASAIQFSAAQAAPVTTPASLSPGDHYRLTFVTNGLSPATSASIADYNNFVAAAVSAVPALAALGTTWHAVVYLSSGDNDGTYLGGTHPGLNGVGVPIYRLDGGLVASTNIEMWSGTRQLPIDIDENGNVVDSLVWTGMSDLGGADYTLGPGFSNYGTFGDSSAAAVGGFKAVGQGAAGLGITDWTGGTAFHLYAMSDELVVPGGAVPEPAELALFGVGLAMLGYLRRKRAA